MAILTQDKGLSHCIQICSSCHQTCTQLVSHCLGKGGDHARAEHIGLLFDCAEICEVSANFMLRNSPLHTQTCASCAQICQRCAEECARFEDDTVMQSCAQECRQCAESCRKMAG